MILALYMLSLVLSAGVTGVFIRQVLGDLGYLSGFEMELMVAGAAGAAYACVQMLYMAFLRAWKPTQSNGPLFGEILSHLGCLVLVPYLMQVEIAWPHALLYKAEPLVFLAGFGVVHGFFKLVSFYAAIRGKPSARVGAIGWVAGSVVAAAIAAWSAQELMASSQQVRPQASAETKYYESGNQYALGREVPEGALVACDLEHYDNACLTFRWANPPAAAPDAEPLEEIHVNLTLEGDETTQRTWPVQMTPEGWADLHIPAVHLPAGLKRCSVTWSTEATPEWQKLVGLHPLTASNTRVLLSGPFQHEGRAPSVAPNFVIVVVEGLAAAHMSRLGYDRPTTPQLDALAAKGVLFTNAYTSAPEIEAACMTLLTGMSPLRHRFLGESHGPLPRGYETLADVLRRNRYATAAFTEGGAFEPGESAFGEDLARGFEIYDVSYRAESETPDETAGSAMTLARAKRWIDSHAGQKFMAFVRLRELADPAWRERYAPGFAEQGARPTPLDVYDSALAYLDAQLGAWIRAVQSGAAGRSTCVVVTSPYGFDFASGKRAQAVIGLTEDSLHVPLIFLGAGVPKAGKRQSPAALEDVAPSLFAMARTGLDYVITGKEMLRNPYPKDPISMFGNPLALSVRTERWRYSWQSGRPAFADALTSDAGAIELFDVAEAARRGRKTDALKRYPDIARRLEGRLSAYLETGAVSR